MLLNSLREPISRGLTSALNALDSPLGKMGAQACISAIAYGVFRDTVLAGGVFLGLQFLSNLHEHVIQQVPVPAAPGPAAPAPAAPAPAAPVPAAPAVPTGFEALGHVGNSTYTPRSVQVEDTSQHRDFSKEILPFADQKSLLSKTEPVDPTWASVLQAWVNVPELMQELNKGFRMSEKEMFGDNGAAFIGHQSPELQTPAKLNKKQALIDIATAFGTSSRRTRAQLLASLRALTQDGLNDLQGLTDEQKKYILKAHVFLELDEIRTSLLPITQDQMNTLIASAQALKDHVDPSWTGASWWTQGSLKTVEMINRTLALAVDEAMSCMQRVGTGADINPNGKNILVLYSTKMDSEIQVMDRGTSVAFQLVSALVHDSKTREALVRKQGRYFGTNWVSCNSKKTRADSSKLPSVKPTITFWVRKKPLF